MLIDGELTEQIIGAAIEVHRELGPGLLESAYEACLCEELRARGLGHRRQVELPLRYKGFELDVGYRLDVIVEERFLLEVKACESLAPIHEAQLLTYLKLSGIRVGLLINFNSPVLRNAIKRRVL
jgi:GxxExxY protein